ncbi:hypothetical protein [Streptomyces sp. NPDC006193]|uniref:hypothetical protein n=1 Tax=Streptomyces sp. NPDC006193 TaxID=3155717 RepID=UPI0033BF67FB
MIQFVVPIAISVGIALLNRGQTDKTVWESAGKSTDGTERELDAVERIGVWANSTHAAVRVERTVSRQWQRSVAWDVKAAMSRALKADVVVAEAELTSTLEVHRGTETTEQHTSSQRMTVDIQPGAHVEILVHWYRQIQTGTLLLTRRAAGDARPPRLAVPYRETAGLLAEVHVNDLPAHP